MHKEDAQNVTIVEDTRLNCAGQMNIQMGELSTDIYCPFSRCQDCFEARATRSYSSVIPWNELRKMGSFARLLEMTLKRSRLIYPDKAIDIFHSV